MKIIIRDVALPRYKYSWGIILSVSWARFYSWSMPLEDRLHQHAYCWGDNDGWSTMRSWNLNKSRSKCFFH